MTDVSRVWIPGGTVACTALGGVVLATVLSLQTPVVQHSLATLFYGLGVPGFNANPVLVARGVTLPTVSREQRLPVFLSRTSDPLRPNVALVAVVSRGGELPQVEPWVRALNLRTSRTISFSWRPRSGFHLRSTPGRRLPSTSSGY